MTFRVETTPRIPLDSTDIVFVLDSNVLSELMRLDTERSAKVEQWLRLYPLGSLYTATPVVAEILLGLERMDEGRRKSGLTRAAEELMTRFAGRMLAFDMDAARTFAAIHNRRRSQGLATPAFDLQIAAIARVAGMAVATRNVMDFRECGVEVVDPWTASSP